MPDYGSRFLGSPSRTYQARLSFGSFQKVAFFSNDQRKEPSAEKSPTSTVVHNSQSNVERLWDRLKLPVCAEYCDWFLYGSLHMTIHTM